MNTTTQATTVERPPIAPVVPAAPLAAGRTGGRPRKLRPPVPFIIAGYDVGAA